MQFRTTLVHETQDHNTVFLSEKSALSLGIFFGDYISIAQGKNHLVSVVGKAQIGDGSIGITRTMMHSHGLKQSKPIMILSETKVPSLKYILKKIRGQTLTKKEIFQIVNDISNQRLSEASIAYFVAAVAKNGLSVRETADLTEAMASSGEKAQWHSSLIADKHCVGGIPGNRTTPIVVAIGAAAGLIIPKTSSRAITSAAGTADVMEVLTHVSLPTKKLKQVVKKTGACLAWGGSLGLAPADDLLIRVERQIDLDPAQQIVASILSKKIAAGSTHVLIDIPVGKGAKISNKDGKYLSDLFKKTAKHFNLNVETILTDGTKPIGKGIGPFLEALDVIDVLSCKKNAPKDLREKSIFLAGKLLELTGKCKKGEGKKTAQLLLDSGKAFRKFNEILDAQGRIRRSIRPGPYSLDFFASSRKGIHWRNQDLNHLARILGCPERKSAGILLHVSSGARPIMEKPLFTIYAESKQDLEEGKQFIRQNKLFDF